MSAQDEQDEEPQVPQTAERYALSKSERDVLRKIEPGRTALIITATMLVLALSWVLPWIGSATGWQVLTGHADPALDVGLLPRLFSVNSAIAGLLLGALALATRRWALAFVAAMACGIVSFEGLVAIWSRQTADTGGPSYGLLLAVASVIVLAVQWLRITWSRQ